MKASFARTVPAAALALLLGHLCFSQSDIRNFDFKNFSYEVEFCSSELSNRITVSNGEFTEEKEVDGYVERRYFSVYGISYGDLDGDGRDEAVVLSVCNTGGTGNFTEAYVFKAGEAEPRRLVTLEGGDRAFGGLRQISVKDRSLIVESSDAGEFGAACCPEFVVTRTYRLKNGALEETARPERRELYPAEFVVFEKGRESAEIDVELDTDPGIRRFKFSAMEGQTLSVTADSENVRFRLVGGEAEIEEESRTLEAELLETGEYVFEVRNFSEAGLKTRITITIKVIK